MPEPAPVTRAARPVSSRVMACPLRSAEVTDASRQQARMKQPQTRPPQQVILRRHGHLTLALIGELDAQVRLALDGWPRQLRREQARHVLHPPAVSPYEM